MAKRPAVTERKPVSFAVVMPALNEEKSIEAVVRQVQAQGGQAIVVDDGSTDQTAALARLAGAHVVSHALNRGYDCALATGLVTARQLGCAYAITMDADGQHDPTLLNAFLRALESGADLVVGHRDRTQRWSEKLFCLVGKWVWGLHDPLCGMKAYRLAAVRDVADFNTYESIGTELALRLVKGGAHTVQPFVRTRPRADASRFGGGFRANRRIAMALFRGLYKALPLKPAP